jgi:hypothetical protein
MIVETCEAATLLQRVAAPNVITVACSQKGADGAELGGWTMGYHCHGGLPCITHVPWSRVAEATKVLGDPLWDPLLCVRSLTAAEIWMGGVHTAQVKEKHKPGADIRA